MKIIEQLVKGLEFLPQARHEVEWIIAHYTKIPKGQLLLFKEQELAPEEEVAISQALIARSKGEPLQYILGEQPFMDLVLLVNEGVLIPRWDSEPVVEKALSLLPANQSLKIADIGTGSGALALAIKYYRPSALVWAVDISPKALAVAKANSQRLNLPLNLVEGDLLDPLPKDESFDLIISNPPYIPTQEIWALTKDVLAEPVLALDGGSDGLDYYRRLAELSSAYLKPGGYLLVEIGSTQGEQVVALWENAGFTQVELGFDYGNRERFVVGKNK